MRIIGSAFALCAVLLAATAVGAEPRGTERYIVTYQPGKGARASSAARLRIERHLPRHDALAVRLSAAEAAQMALEPDVLLVERDPPRYPVSILRARPSGADKQPAATAAS